MPNDITVDRGRPGPSLGAPASQAVSDLLAAYLSAVAAQLAGHDIRVRALRIDEIVRHEEQTLTGSLTLVPAVGPPRWAPTGLRWDEHSGWSAVLRHTTEPRLGVVLRHLNSQLAPTPLIVTHFVIELDRDPNTIWATALEQHPAPLDRRHLAMELAGYSFP